MKFELLETITFGRGGNSRTYQTYGFSDPEAGYTFGVDGRSACVVGVADPSRDLVIEFALRPFVHKALLPAQRIGLRINGSSIGYARITQPATIAFLIPRYLVSSRTELVVEQPDAARPADVGGSEDKRRLGIAFHTIRIYQTGLDAPRSPDAVVKVQLGRSGGLEAATKEVEQAVGMPADQLVTEFESLGDNCEFGIVQRFCGAEPLGLFRFSSITIDRLHRGLLNGFEGLGDPANIQPRLEDKPLEWMVHERQYGLRYHTRKREMEASEDEIRTQEEKRLRFLRRKLLEDLREKSKIFVCKREEPLSVEEVLPVFLALNADGPCSLLFVVPATKSYAPGTCEEILPGFYRGHIDKLASSSTPGWQSSIGWLEVCAAAYLLRRRDRQPLTEVVAEASNEDASNTPSEPKLKVPPETATPIPYRRPWRMFGRRRSAVKLLGKVQH